ncbi:NAD-dependent epimerase/dehydratase family protein [Nocardioides sp. LML1-1-1.1]|uniref:NAD-dependent epimerase/dehydratase family protein n=1 Tax=Nocardioides sp. LML1-1-1.1 TaxID=3135248 RepID=UPI00342631A8
MKVVVTGASGNIGTACLRALTADGRHQVVGVARRRPDLERASPLASVSWHPGDVGYDDLDPVLTGADAVVHLAWKFQPTHGPRETWRTNAVGTRRLLAAVRRRGVPVVVAASSVAAYSPVDHDRPVDEGAETDGTSEAAYCREKAYNERVLDAFEAATPGTRVVRLRPAFVFQRSAASEQRRIFGGALVRPRMLDRRLVPVLPVPRGLRLQAVHAGDVGRAVAAAVERPVSGAFNLAADDVLRRPELGELMGAPTIEVPAGVARAAMDAAWHARLLPVPGSLLAALLGVPLLDTTRARTELAWTPRQTAGQAVGQMVDGAAMPAGSRTPPLHP